jgi:hypothetical protein
MVGVAKRRAARALEGVLEAFGRTGYTTESRPGPLRARLRSANGHAIAVELVPQGRIFGGAYGLEVSTAAPVLPPSHGLRARGRGVVRMKGVAFRAGRRDEAGQELARRLAADGPLAEALTDVHFERLRIEPDGRPVIRHMGGSLVWILFPPLVKQIPFVDSQARATAKALAAFARAVPRV